MGLSAVRILFETSTLSFELRNLEGPPVPFSGLRKESNAGISVSWPPTGVRLQSHLLLRPGLHGSGDSNAMSCDRGTVDNTCRKIMSKVEGKELGER